MITLTHAGRLALAQGHARQALELLSEKHTLVIATWGKDSVFSATSAVDLADACLAVGNMREANDLLEWSIGRYMALGIDDERVLRAQLALAISAYQAADYQRAEKRFTSLINRYEALGPAQDFARAIAMDYLAQVYLRQSKTNAAEPLLLKALTIFEREGSDPSATAICLGLLARIRFMNERYREAEQLQRRAIAIHEATKDEMSLAKELDHIGATLAMRAQSEQRRELAVEAVVHGERAIAIFEKYLPADHVSLLASKQNLAKFRAMSESIGMMFPGARESAKGAAPAMPDGHPHVIVQLLTQSRQLSETRDYRAAFELAREGRDRALRIFGDHTRLADDAVAQMVGVLRRHCSYLLGEPTGLLLPSESFAMQIRAHTRRGIAEDETAEMPDIDPGTRIEIEGLLLQGVEIVSAALASASLESGDLSSAHVIRSRGSASDVLEILHYARLFGVLKNQAAAVMAFDLMQLHGNHGAALGLATSVRQVAENNERRALREEYRLSIFDRESLIRSLVEPADQAAVSSAAARMEELPMLEQKIARLKEQLEREGQAEVEPQEMRFAFNDAQSVLHSNEAIVAIHVGSRAIFVIAVKPEAIVFKRVEVEGDLVGAMCDALLESATLSENKELPNFDFFSALQIHDLVFYPLRDFLKPGLHLLILGDGPLWTIPLGCLIVEPMDRIVTGTSPVKESEIVDAAENEGDVKEVHEELDGFAERNMRLSSLQKWLETRSARDALSEVSERQGWLADRYNISLMPSLAGLTMRNSGVNPPNDRKAFLGIGDPDIGSIALPTHLAVPETRRILTNLATSLGGDPARDVIVGRAATIDRLVDLSESGELARHVLCFATHAIYPREDDDLLTDAGLLFSQGEILSAFDVASLRIDADFVLLTACFTGAPSGRSITVPLSGLAQAFLTAGARSLLVSHWPVEVQSTELFVQALAATIGDHNALVDAHAAAQKRVRNASGEHNHPAFWAGFSIIGDGATRPSLPGGRPIVVGT
ncbi:CHAT domain-containing protein [Rhizobium leguminosarum]